MLYEGVPKPAAVLHIFFYIHTVKLVCVCVCVWLQLSFAFRFESVAAVALIPLVHGRGTLSPFLHMTLPCGVINSPSQWRKRRSQPCSKQVTTYSRLPAPSEPPQSSPTALAFNIRICLKTIKFIWFDLKVLQSHFFWSIIWNSEGFLPADNIFPFFSRLQTRQQVAARHAAVSCC